MPWLSLLNNNPQREFLLGLSDELTTLRREVNSKYALIPSAIVPLIEARILKYLEGKGKILKEVDCIKLIKYFIGLPSTTANNITLRKFLRRDKSIKNEIYEQFQMKLTRPFDHVFLNYIAKQISEECYIAQPEDNPDAKIMDLSESIKKIQTITWEKEIASIQKSNEEETVRYFEMMRDFASKQAELREKAQKLRADEARLNDLEKRAILDQLVLAQTALMKRHQEELAQREQQINLNRQALQDQADKIKSTTAPTFVEQIKMSLDFAAKAIADLKDQQALLASEMRQMVTAETESISQELDDFKAMQLETNQSILDLVDKVKRELASDHVKSNKALKEQLTALEAKLNVVDMGLKLEHFAKEEQCAKLTNQYEALLKQFEAYQSVSAKAADIIALRQKNDELHGILLSTHHEQKKKLEDLALFAKENIVAIQTKLKTFEHLPASVSSLSVDLGQFKLTVVNKVNKLEEEIIAIQKGQMTIKQQLDDFKSLQMTTNQNLGGLITKVRTELASELVKANKPLHEHLSVLDTKLTVLERGLQNEHYIKEEQHARLMAQYNTLVGKFESYELKSIKPEEISAIKEQYSTVRDDLIKIQHEFDEKLKEMANQSQLAIDSIQLKLKAFASLPGAVGSISSDLDKFKLTVTSKISDLERGLADIKKSQLVVEQELHSFKAMQLNANKDITKLIDCVKFELTTEHVKANKDLNAQLSLLNAKLADFELEFKLEQDAKHEQLIKLDKRYTDLLNVLASCELSSVKDDDLRFLKQQCRDLHNDLIAKQEESTKKIEKLASHTQENLAVICAKLSKLKDLPVTVANLNRELSGFKLSIEHKIDKLEKDAGSMKMDLDLVKLRLAELELEWRKSQGGLDPLSLNIIINKQIESFLMHHHYKLDIVGEVTRALPKHMNAKFCDISVDQKIGSGKFGLIFKGKWKEQTVAIKQIDGILTEDDRKIFIREAYTMSGLSHDNIVAFRGACLESRNTCLLMSYMEKGRLVDVLPSLSREQILAVSKDLAKGLYYLHDQGVIHADIKPSNVLIDSEDQAKWYDFGLAKIPHTNSIMSLKTIVSKDIIWHAPEILNLRANLSMATDVYSYGLLLWSMFSRKQPYDGISDDFVKAELGEELFKGIPDECLELIKSCLQVDPTKRPKAIDIVRMIQEITLRPRSPTGEDLLHMACVFNREKKYDEYYTFLQRAIDKGSDEAITNLGVMLLEGKGGRLDKIRARELLELGVAKGQSLAMFSLGRMYEKQDGVDQDLTRALSLYRQCLAVDPHNERAKNKIKKFEEHTIK